MTPLILLALLPAQDNPGFVRPHEDTLRKVLGVRYQKALGEFSLLEINQEEWTQPLISDDNVRGFVGTRRGLLVAYDISSGEQLWKRDDMGAIGYAMAEFRQKLILGSDSALVAVDQQIGRERWRVDLDATVGGPIVVTGTIAIVPVRPNAFLGIDLIAAEKIWEARRPTPEGITVRGQARPAVDRRRGVAYLGYSDGALVAVDVQKGNTKWVALLGNARDFFADVDSEPMITDGGKTVIAAAYNTGVFKVNADDGNVVWETKQTRISGLARAGDGFMVAIHGDRQVLGMYTANGKVRWRFKFKEGAPIGPVYLGRNMVAAGNTDGPIAILDVDTGRPIQLINPMAGISVPPAWDDPDLLVFTNKALLMVLRYGAGVSAAPRSLAER